MDKQSPKRFLIAVPAIVLFFSLYGRFLWAPTGFAPAELFFDFYAYFYPVSDAAWSTVRGGELPLWNPYIFSGTPFLAAIETQLLYPPNLLHLFVSTARAFNLLLVLHVLLGASGTWLYCRGRGRSIGGSLFACMIVGVLGRLVLHTYGGHPTLVYSAFWWPIILWRTDRCLRNSTLRNTCTLAIVLACQFLAGYPMFTLLNAYLIPAYLVVFGIDRNRPGLPYCPRILAACGTAAVLALGLVAVQLLPTLELIGESQRSELSYDWTTSASFPPVNLLTFLVPDFFGDDRAVAYWAETSVWESSAYCGVLTLLLVVVSAANWRNREFLFWAAVSLLLIGVSLGRYSPMYDICYLYLPGVDKFRGVSKLTVYVGFAFSFLSAMGFDIVVQNAAAYRRRLRIVFLLVVCVSAAGVCWAGFNVSQLAPTYWQSFVESVRESRFTLLTTIPTPTESFYNLSWQVMNSSLLVSSGVLLASATAILLSHRSKRVQRLTPVILCGIAALELYHFADRYMLLSDTRPFRAPAARIAELTSHDHEPWRFSCLSADPPLINQFLYEDLPSPGGNEDFILDRYSSFIDLATGIKPQMQTYLSLPYNPVLFDLLNVKYFAVASRFRTVDLLNKDEVVVENAFQYANVSFDLYRNPDVHPRVRIEHEPIVVQSRTAATGLMAQNLRHHNAHAVVEGQPAVALRSASEDERAVERAEIVEYSANGIAIDAELQQPAMLVLSENIYPGWEATLDGTGVDILPANLFMRSVAVPAGKHRIKLVYRPVAFRRGVIISVATLVVMGLMLLVPWRVLLRRRGSPHLHPGD
ncbi:MAG TPA: hypothetical protein EYG03_21120 [Planctomycetes bacterium]|nr:hypothetical protein [Planctomycetota bacterium]